MSDRPPKPYRDFPLFANQNGQWAKKIRGRVRYFGSWRDDHNGARAIERYKRELPYLQSGEPIPNDTTGLTIGDLFEQFLAAKAERVKAGELSARTLAGYQFTARRVLSIIGDSRSVESLSPRDFASLRSKLAEGQSVSSLASYVRHTRIVMRWASEMDLVDSPVKVGPEFREPSRADKRRSRNQQTRTRGSREFTREEILILLAILRRRPQLRAMVLLAINCGFGQTDVATLPRSALTRNLGWIDYARAKTAIDRRCPLWPETAEALREVLPMKHATPANPDDADLVFLTTNGLPWARMRESTREDGTVRWTTIDSVGLEFGKVLRRVGIKRDGVNFYALRHTFQTIAEESGDTVAVSKIMGHADNTMADLYRERFPDQRLLKASSHVRQWLFGIR